MLHRLLPRFYRISKRQLGKQWSFYISLNLVPTVVTDVKHMNGAWTSRGSQSAQPGTRVADYVKAGGESYNGAFNNCHDASRRMMNVGKGKR